MLIRNFLSASDKAETPKGGFLQRSGDPAAGTGNERSWRRKPDCRSNMQRNERTNDPPIEGRSRVLFVWKRRLDLFREGTVGVFAALQDVFISAVCRCLQQGGIL